MDREFLRLSDRGGDDALISLTTGATRYIGVDFDPDEKEACVSYMEYTPDQARSIAAALILAADEADRMEKS